MIRAFDYVVRVNRKDGCQAAVVIANAIQTLFDTEDFKTVVVQEYRMNSDRYPLLLTQWIRKIIVDPLKKARQISVQTVWGF